MSTKLKQKLIELGYEKGKMAYQKRLKGNFEIYIYVFPNELVGGVEQHDHYVMYQSQINNLQQAYDVLQKDLEALRELCQVKL